MNSILKRLLLLVLFSIVVLGNYGYASENNEKQDVQINERKSDKEINSDEKNAPNSSVSLTGKEDSAKEESLKGKDETVKEPEKAPRRSLKIDETFILTDKTRANTFRINSEKKWSRFSDKFMISYDIIGQEDETGKMRAKEQRFELNYKLYAHSFSKKQPFVEYHYSTDKPTKLNWKVIAGGIGKKLPFDFKFDIGYGYKWGNVQEEDLYKYDVVTLNLNNKQKISNFTIKQNLKTITPRNVEPDKQPIYDYRSSVSTPITKNISGAVCFDWRYQKLPELQKEDWFNYTLKFGLTFIPIK